MTNDVKDVSGADNGVALCKLPSGILLEFGKPNTPEYRTVFLKGSNDAHAIGGFGFTAVKVSDYKAWTKKHENFRAVRGGFIKLAANLEEAQAYALDQSQNRNGLERLSIADVPKQLEVEKESQKAVAAGLARTAQ